MTPISSPIARMTYPEKSTTRKTEQSQPDGDSTVGTVFGGIEFSSRETAIQQKIFEQAARERIELTQNSAGSSSSLSSSSSSSATQGSSLSQSSSSPTYSVPRRISPSYSRYKIETALNHFAYDELIERPLVIKHLKEISLDGLDLSVSEDRPRLKVPKLIYKCESEWRMDSVEAFDPTGKNFGMLFENNDYTTALFAGKSTKFTKLQKAHFRHTVLNGTDFNDADLSGTRFDFAACSKVNFNGATLNNAVFDEVVMDQQSFATICLDGLKEVSFDTARTRIAEGKSAVRPGEYYREVVGDDELELSLHMPE